MHEENEEDDIELISKSQIKREMHAMQSLALELTELKAETLAKLPLSPKLEEAIQETRNIKKREALRRHKQYLGRVMRDADHEAIAEALDNIKGRSDRLARLQPLMEQWRENLISGDNDRLATFIQNFPNGNRQRLRQLVSNAKKERGQGKTNTAARKLFLLIKECISEHTP